MHSTCEHTKQISPWIDGELPEEESRFLEAHVHVCAACLEEMESLKQLSDLFTVLRDAKPGCDPSSLRRAPVAPDSDVTRVRFRRALSLAALLLIGVGALFGLGQDLTDPELRFEQHLEHSIDEDVLHMTTLGEDQLSRDQVVGMLISSSH